MVHGFEHLGVLFQHVLKVQLLVERAAHDRHEFGVLAAVVLGIRVEVEGFFARAGLGGFLDAQAFALPLAVLLGGFKDHGRFADGGVAGFHRGDEVQRGVRLVDGLGEFGFGVVGRGQVFDEGAHVAAVLNGRALVLVVGVVAVFPLRGFQ